MRRAQGRDAPRAQDQYCGLAGARLAQGDHGAEMAQVAGQLEAIDGEADDGAAIRSGREPGAGQGVADLDPPDGEVAEGV
jgi:hypothetical protein